MTANQTLTPERAVKIALNVCDVLDYVENHGVFHRDLRPENVMVGANDNIKLINFGTAAIDRSAPDNIHQSVASGRHFGLYRA